MQKGEAGLLLATEMRGRRKLPASSRKVQLCLCCREVKGDIVCVASEGGVEKRREEEGGKGTKPCTTRKFACFFAPWRTNEEGAKGELRSFWRPQASEVSP